MIRTTPVRGEETLVRNNFDRQHFQRANKFYRLI
jgi:hypothetical protein